MDPHSLHQVLEDAVRLSLLPSPKQDSKPLVLARGISGPYPPKRHILGPILNTTFFPSQTGYEEKRDNSDASSTWSYFSEPGPRGLSPTGGNTSDGGSIGSTPAQEIIIRYRNRQPLDTDAAPAPILTPTSPASALTPASPASALTPDSTPALTPGSTPTSQSSPSSSVRKMWIRIDGYAVSEYISIRPMCQELKVIRPQSSTDSLAKSHEEAMKLMERSGLGESDQLVCQRPGCRDTVRNVQAMVYHLHIHAIDNKILTLQAEQRLDKQKEMAMELYVPVRAEGGIRRRLLSLPTLVAASPIMVMDSFSRVLGRVTAC